MSTTPDLSTPPDGSTTTGVFAAAAGYPALRWSAEKPRAAGWWGYHNGVAQPPVIVRVWESVSMPGKLYAAMGDYGIDVVTEMAGWWFGPIELPDPFARTTPDNVEVSHECPPPAPAKEET